VEARLREGAELMGRLREANVLGVVLRGDQVYERTTQSSTSSAYTVTTWRRAYLGPRVSSPGMAGQDAAALQQLRRTGLPSPTRRST